MIALYIDLLKHKQIA